MNALKLKENLSGSNQSYLFPFFWQHGESNEVIMDYLNKMNEQGIKNACIESRHYKGFMTERWWEILDLILSEARKREMKIWLLDDYSFPTGVANHKVPEELKKSYLECRRVDVVGPNTHAEIDLTNLAGFRAVMMNQERLNNKIVAVYLTENNVENTDQFFYQTAQDVTGSVEGNTLRLKLDAKDYSLFILYSTTCGQEKMTEDHLDPMRKEAAQVLLDEVYEPHYQRYKEYFGNTIVGFFSDEPRFGNVKGSEASIGRMEMPLPWNEDVEEECKARGIFDKLFLLFHGEVEEKYHVSYEFMDIVTTLYSNNFSKVIGNYCIGKNIDYVGHIIEDNGAHARLGYGAGHYFRSIAGQTIAGIDIIGGQVVPGMDYQHSAFNVGGSNGEFYHYALCKLGASAAKLDPIKQGLCMCESFGAYGWYEGLKMMKWITDHMISHGVNRIVPHAFDPKEFPDWDCPPHFYAHGNNPQYPYFHKWANYADRLCNLMQDGYQVSKIGVLYHAFAEWSGDYMPIEKVLKELQTNQIACDIVSEDYLMDCDNFETGFTINGYPYEMLIVPYAERLPLKLINKIVELSRKVKVVFIKGIPARFPETSQCEVSELSELIKLHMDNATREIKTSSKENKLVYYHYKRENEEIFMFTNEDIKKGIHTEISLKFQENLVEYDAYKNKVYAFDYTKEDGEISFDLNLEPYQSLILVTGTAANASDKPGKRVKKIDESIQISLKAYNESAYRVLNEVTYQDYLGGVFSDFTGNIKYDFSIDVDQKNIFLEVTEAFEVVTLKVNGKECETLISPPYLFDIEDLLTDGKNSIEVNVINTLQRSIRDGVSEFYAADPLGITGDIFIVEKK